MIDPFGKAACEAELTFMGPDKYSDLYFDETPFNKSAGRDEVFLVVGRRGSGKTALAQSLSFRTASRNPICIEVRRPEDYQHVLAEISTRTSPQRTTAVYHLRKVWEFVIWQLVANAIASQGPIRPLVQMREHASGFVADVIKYLMSFIEETNVAPDNLSFVVKESNLSEVQHAAINIALERPIIIAIDTLEQYDASNDALMYAIAALIEFAAEFNLKFAQRNIHLKVFVSGEIFPHLKETVLLAPAKVITHPVYMLWRPKDLLRLICWRLHRFLDSSQTLPADIRKLDWDDPDEIRHRFWERYFGRSLQNSRGIGEESWLYVLRHTQMRPRQLILLCNTIANLAIEDGTFPHFKNEHIVTGIRQAERELASEIINSFSAIYPRLNEIVSALMKLPMLFNGSELDKRAPQTAAEWHGDYSPGRFRRLVAELGIIGRAARGDETTSFVDADFEYSLNERLELTHRDLCVVHPMFYRRLNVELNAKALVMPFSSRQGDFADAS